MSNKVAMFVVPANAFGSVEDLAGAVWTALDGRDLAGGPPFHLRVAPPVPASRSHLFTFVSRGDEVDRDDVDCWLADHPAFATRSMLCHDDQTGTYWFEHNVGDQLLSLGSVGPYLCGDVDAFLVDYPQRGFSNLELLAFHEKDPQALSAREWKAIGEYMNAVEIGTAMFYPTPLDYLSTTRPWQVWRLGDGGVARITDDGTLGPCLDLAPQRALFELTDWLERAP